MLRQLSHLKLRSKLILGFATVLALSAVDMTVAQLGLNRVAASAASYQEIVVQSDVTRDIDRELVAFRLLMKYFAVTGDDPDRVAAKESETALSNAIQTAIKVATSYNRESFLKLQAAFSDLTKLFDRLVTLKTSNGRIGTDELRLINSALRGQIEALVSATEQPDTSELNARIKRYAVDAAAAAAAINNYVSRPDDAVAAGGSAKLSVLKKGFDALTSNDQAVMRSISDISRQITKYDASFERYLSNTAQIEELLDNANAAADVIVRDADAIKTAVVDA